MTGKLFIIFTVVLSIVLLVVSMTVNPLLGIFASCLIANLWMYYIDRNTKGNSKT